MYFCHIFVDGCTFLRDLKDSTYIHSTYAAAVQVSKQHHLNTHDFTNDSGRWSYCVLMCHNYINLPCILLPMLSWFAKDFKISNTSENMNVQVVLFTIIGWPSFSNVSGLISNSLGKVCITLSFLIWNSSNYNSHLKNCRKSWMW